jgi:hypothetical protein
VPPSELAHVGRPLGAEAPTPVSLLQRARHSLRLGARPLVAGPVNDLRVLDAMGGGRCVRLRPGPTLIHGGSRGGHKPQGPVCD